MNVVLSEHLPLLASAPDGIQKLRGLILELAVRGKLVPQDPNDEAASELLKRIGKERARLEAEGTCRKSKAVPPVGEDEQPFALPDKWEWVRLGTLSRNVQYGYTASADHASRDVLFVRITDIQDNRVNWDAVPGCQIPVADVSAYQLQRGDILIARTGGTIGKSYLVEGLDRPAIFASYLIRVGYLCGTDATFTKVFLGSECYWSQLYANSMGTGQPNVNGTALSGLTFPLPPLAEQHRIVAKVDELMALCDRLEAEQTDAESAHAKLVETLLGTLTQSRDANELATYWQRLNQHFDTLFSTETSLDALKQTILQLAVMGKLVPQDPSDEPASELLKRIAKEKARLVAEGKIRKDKALTATSEDETAFELPLSWAWCRLGNVVTESGAGWSPSCEGVPRVENNWGVLKVSAVSWGEFDPSANKALPTHLEARPEHEVLEGDFLVSRANTAELIARSVVVLNCPSHLMLSDKIVRLKLSALCDRRYINLANTSVAARNYYARVAGGTSSSMKNVTREQILRLNISLPPLAEQHRIVAKVDEMMALCDRLKAVLAEARSRQTRLSTTLIEAALKAA